MASIKTTASRLLGRWKGMVAKHDEKEAAFKRAEAELKATPWPHPKDTLVSWIAKALAADMGCTKHEVSGPFGICCEVMVKFWGRGRPKSISFIVIHDDGVRVRDYSRDMGNYTPGSIGAMNGMNFPEVKVPKGATLAWFKQFVK